MSGDTGPKLMVGGSTEAAWHRNPADLVPSVDVLCSANRFRSVIVSAALEHVWGRCSVVVRSHATSGASGQPAVTEVTDGLSRLGLDVSTHRSLALQPGALHTSALVIGFEPSHIATAIVVGGAARDRTFLFREVLLALDARGAAESEDAIALSERVRLLGVGRVVNVDDPRFAEPDPVLRPRRTFERTVERLFREAHSIAQRLKAP